MSYFSSNKYKNQLFILFLIPVICILLHSELTQIKFKNKTLIIAFFQSLVFFLLINIILGITKIESFMR